MDMTYTEYLQLDNLNYDYHCGYNEEFIELKQKWETIINNLNLTFMNLQD